MQNDALRRDSQGMTHTITPRTLSVPTVAAIPPPTRGQTLTRAEFNELVGELDRLRAAHRADLAERLRDARAFGSPGDDDDWLTVMEDAAVEQGRIRQFERLVAAATVVDEAPDGDFGARLGSIVRVQHDDGRTVEYELAGWRNPQDAASAVSLGSPVGRALVGVRPGDVVGVQLPSGRERSLRVLDVRAARAVERAAR
jgi:transcription elongation factor GreA